MSFPKGLKFRDRRAEHEGRAFFDCTRAGHPAGQRRIKRAFETRRDRELYITRHDAQFHDELLAAQLGIKPSPSLAEIVADFMQHIRDLAKQGKRDSKTVRYYDGITKMLIEHFGGETPIASIGRRAGLAYVKSRRLKGSTSQGARFVKELKVVRRLQAFADLTVIWHMPTDDISPVHNVRKSIPIEDIRDFLRAMPEDSLERVFATTKFVTMLRNEELYAANVGDVTVRDDGTGELVYTLRNKQTGDKVQHVTHIPTALLRLLTPLLTRPAKEPLFVIEGRRLTEWSLRKRFIRASERASVGRDRPVKITAIGQFRHEAATIAMEELDSTKAVSDHLDHKDERTTRKHYKLNKRDVTLKQSKRVTEATEGKLVN